MSRTQTTLSCRRDAGQRQTRGKIGNDTRLRCSVVAKVTLLSLTTMSFGVLVQEAGHVLASAVDC